MFRKSIVSALLVLSLALPVAAQEVTPAPEPTSVEATPEPTVAPEPPPAPPAPIFDGVTTSELLLYLGLSALAGGGVLAIGLRFIERKDVRDRIEDARNSWTVEQQEFLRKFTDTLRDTNNRILDFLESVQDGQPNQ